MLKQRLITAAILIPVMLLILFYVAGPAFLILTALITLAAAWEWTRLMQVTSMIGRIAYLVIMTITFVAVLYVPIPYIIGSGFIFWLLSISLIMRFPKGSQWWAKSVFARGVMGLLVLVPCWAAINFLRNVQDGTYALLFVFVLVWGADTAAYFVGKRWGKTPLAPNVSPGKSVQGVIGALVSAVVITLVMFWLYTMPLDLWSWGVMLAIATVIFSIVGDLFESMLKRQAGVKDSGQLLPGHGGLLDRIDSLTAAAPVFTFGWMVIATYLN